jgi:hypothetical protein
MSKNIKKEICVISKDNFDELIKEFDLDNSDGLTAMNIFSQTESVEKVEDFLNTLNENHFYSLSYQDESDSGKFFIEVVRVDASQNESSQKSEIPETPLFGNIGMNEIVEMFSPENNSEVLPKRKVENPQTYVFKNIKDILDVMTEENYKYFLADFESFIKMILQIKKSIEIGKNMRESGQFKELFENVSAEDLEEGVVIPDSFEWIDDGIVDATGIIEMKDLEGNELGTIKMDGKGKVEEINIENLSEEDKAMLKKLGIDPKDLMK